MIKQTLKIILAGILAGLALFMLPFFLLRFLAFFLLIGAAMKLMGGGRRRFRHRQFAFAERYRTMSDEEREALKTRMGGRCGPFDPEKEAK